MTTTLPSKAMELTPLTLTADTVHNQVQTTSTTPLSTVDACNNPDWENLDELDGHENDQSSEPRSA